MAKDANGKLIYPTSPVELSTPGLVAADQAGALDPFKFQRITVPLDAARDGEVVFDDEVMAVGVEIPPGQKTSNANATIILSHKKSQARFDIADREALAENFSRLYVTNDAQPGESFDIIVHRNPLIIPVLSNRSVGQSQGLLNSNNSRIDPATVAKQDEIISTLQNATEIGMDTGTATGGSNNTLQDTGKNWGSDIYSGARVQITAGTGSGQTREISGNTSDTLTVASNWTTVPDSSSEYRIYGAPAIESELDLMTDALQSQAGDEMRVRVHDSGGTQIDPATEGTISSILSRLQALDDALKSSDTDRLVTILTNTSNTEIDPATETGNLATVAALADALKSNDTDELVSRLANSSGTEIDPATEGGNLASILGQLDITISALRDALQGSSSKDFTTLETDLESLNSTDFAQQTTEATQTSTQISSSGDNVILSGSAGVHFRIRYMVISVPSTGSKQEPILIKDGSNTEIMRVNLANNPDGFAFDGKQFPLHTSDGNDFVMNLPTADNVDVSVISEQV